MDVSETESESVTDTEDEDVISSDGEINENVEISEEETEKVIVQEENTLENETEENEEMEAEDIEEDVEESEAEEAEEAEEMEAEDVEESETEEAEEIEAEDVEESETEEIEAEENGEEEIEAEASEAEETEEESETEDKEDSEPMDENEDNTIESRNKEAIEQSAEQEKRVLAESEQNKNNSSNKNVEAPTKKISTRPAGEVLPPIAIEFGLTKIKAGLLRHGKIYLIPSPWGQTKYPTKVGITQDEKVLIGEELELRPKEDVKLCFDLSDDLVAPSTETFMKRSVDLKFEYGELPFTKEVLSALILGTIKSFAEEDLKGILESVVITVPLWYTSSQRQATKDAAKIAGFSDVEIITETAASALAWTSGRKGINNLLVVMANKYRFDAAVYVCCDRDVKMLSCDGNTHNDKIAACKKENVSAQEIEHVGGYLFFGKQANDEYAIHIHQTIKNCVGRKRIDGVVVVTDEAMQAQIIESEIRAVVRNHANPWPFRKHAIITGAAHYTDVFSVVKDMSSRIVFTDMLPYKIEGFKGEGAYSNIIFERCSQLHSIKEVKQHFPFEAISGRSVSYAIFENGNSHIFFSGKLTVPVQPLVQGSSEENPTKRRGKISFSLNREGILRVAAFYTDTVTNERIPKVTWESNNLSEAVVNVYRRMTGTFLNCWKLNHAEKFEQAKDDLVKLATFLLENGETVQNANGKDKIRSKAKASLKEVVDISNMSLEVIANSMSALNKLKSKYLAAADAGMQLP